VSGLPVTRSLDAPGFGVGENKVSSTRVPEFETELGLRRHYMSLSCKCLVPQIDTFIGRARAKPCPLLPQFYIT
jgi:hypothetical protein